MSTHTAQTVYDQALGEFIGMLRDFGVDILAWVSRLTDMERLMGLVAFILVLFLLVISKASTRRREPGKARSFASAFTLVVVFSFFAGLVIDARFDASAYVPGNIL